MATFKVKKVAVDATDLGGLLSSRYEKLQVSYGVIPPITNGAATYASGDTIVFSDVPSRSIVRATVIAHLTDKPAVLEVFPGSDKNVPFTLSLPTGVTAPVELSYVIEYVRGTGRVGTTTGDNSGEGDLFTVVIANSSTSVADAELQVARPAVQLLSTTQFGALSTDQLVALKVQEMPAITTGELRALTTAQVVAFTSTQANALTTTQVASLTAGQAAVIRRTV